MARKLGRQLGYGAAVLATVGALGWGAKKLSDRRKRHPHYPSDATPDIPASETKAPS